MSRSCYNVLFRILSPIQARHLRADISGRPLACKQYMGTAYKTRARMPAKSDVRDKYFHHPRHGNSTSTQRYLYIVFPRSSVPATRRRPCFPTPGVMLMYDTKSADVLFLGCKSPSEPSFCKRPLPSQHTCFSPHTRPIYRCSMYETDLVQPALTSICPCAWLRETRLACALSVR